MKTKRFNYVSGTQTFEENVVALEEGNEDHSCCSIAVPMPIPNSSWSGVKQEVAAIAKGQSMKFEQEKLMQQQKE